MDENKEILDFLKGQDDLHERVIRTIGNAKEKLEEDSLRILRAIRFATSLNFSLSDEIKEAILLTKHLLKDLSYNRKKEELDKIFASKNVNRGISLLLEFGLDKELELERLREIKNTDSLISVWSMLNVIDIYPFTSSEKTLINNINKVMNEDNLDPMTLYQYGLYVNSIAGTMKNIERKEITKAYNGLPIHSKSDIAITSNQIMELLKRGPGEYLKEIYCDLESKILYHRLVNEEKTILEYIRKRYQ